MLLESGWLSNGAIAVLAVTVFYHEGAGRFGTGIPQFLGSF
ncbi:hypothetical protein [Leptolyngbya sp. FACHB-36]|nr:hypothetical protein [Leptolyngbya sp. FACHB-36]